MNKVFLLNSPDITHPYILSNFVLRELPTPPHDKVLVQDNRGGYTEGFICDLDDEALKHMDEQSPSFERKEMDSQMEDENGGPIIIWVYFYKG